MVDIHCHILPGVDDGAEDRDEALLMARMAANSGSRIIVATPHFGYSGASLTAADIRRKAAWLQETARAEGLPITVLSGMELLCNHRLEQILAEKSYLTLADSRYLLTEFYFDESPEMMDRMLEMVMEQGLVPIVAHPERYDAVQQDPYLVVHWMEQGCGIQINAGSILGYLGKSSQMAAKWLVHNGLAHLVASDGHSLETRTPRLNAVRDYLEERVSVDCAQALLYDNPRLVLRDKALPRYV